MSALGLRKNAVDQNSPPSLTQTRQVILLQSQSRMCSRWNADIALGIPLDSYISDALQNDSNIERERRSRWERVMGVMGILSRDRQNNAFRWLLIGGKRNSSERRGYAAARGEGAVGNSTLLGGDGWVKLRPAGRRCPRLPYRPDGRQPQGDCRVGAEDRVDGESDCWRGDHIGACGRTETVTRPQLPSG